MGIITIKYAGILKGKVTFMSKPKEEDAKKENRIDGFRVLKNFGIAEKSDPYQEKPAEKNLFYLTLGYDFVFRN